MAPLVGRFTAPNMAHCDAGSGSHPLHQWRLRLAVVNPTCAGAPEEGERTVMRVKDHLLALAHVARANIIRLWQSRTCATFTVSQTGERKTVWYTPNKRWAKQFVVVTDLQMSRCSPCLRRRSLPIGTKQT